MDSIDFYRHIINDAPFGYALHEITAEDDGNTRCRFIEVNKSFMSFFNIVDQAIVGKTIEDAFANLNNNIKHILLSAYDEAVKNKTKINNALELSLHNQLSVLDLHIKATDANKLITIVCHKSAITQATEQQCAKTVAEGSVPDNIIEAIFNLSPVAMLVIDESASVIAANKTARSLYDETDAPASFKHGPGDVLLCANSFGDSQGCGHAPECSDCAFRKTIESILQSNNDQIKNVDINLPVIRNNEKVFCWFSISANSMEVNGNRIICIAFVDVTERKKQESELLVIKEQAEESNRLKTAFINNISHEIRTPLNGIMGFGDLIIENGLPDDLKMEYYRVLKDSSNRLQTTITDIIDISEINAGTIHPIKSDVDIFRVMNDLLEKLKLTAAHKNLTVSLDVSEQYKDLVLETDEELFTKVMTHLLNNAEKFTDKGGIIMGYEMTGESVQFFVKDTGRGIMSDKLEAVFETFMQEDVSSTRGYEGSGLGLSIAKGLAELLGGNLCVKSTKGEGSAFYFSLPLPAIKQKTLLKNEASQINYTPNRSVILIAEDDEFNYKLLKVFIKKSGFSSLHAHNGAEAVEFCKKHSEIGLVLMDIKMPVMNGLEATAHIKKIRPELPVIALTAYAQTTDRQKMLQAGCDEYLAKPVNMGTLNTMIKKMLAV